MVLGFRAPDFAQDVAVREHASGMFYNKRSKAYPLQVV